MPPRATRTSVSPSRRPATFTPTWIGTLGINRGGTGIATPPTYGQLLLGNGGGGYALAATSTLGISSSDITEGSKLFYTDGRVATYLDTVAKEYFFATSSADFWRSQRDLFSTSSAAYFLAQNQGNAFSSTSASYFLAQNQGAAFSTTSANHWLTTKSTSNLAEGSNLYFTDARVQTYLDTISKGYFYSTTSSDHWLTTKTTDNLAQGSTNKYYNDSLVNTFVGASSTIAKTFTTNVFTALNSFTGGLAIGTLNGPLQANNGVVSATTTIGVLYGGTGSTTLTGLLKGNGTNGVLTAVANTDYQLPITLTTTGSSGAATFNGTTLNIPQYAGATYTGTYPVQVSGSVISLAFGTSTSNTWGGTQTFTNTPVLGTLSGLVGANNGALYQVATTTLYGTGAGGQVLTWNNGAPQWVATTTYSAGSGISTSFAAGALTITNTGVLAIGPTGQTQTGTVTIATSTTGTDFTVTASAGTITFNLPTASASNRGLLSSTDWTTFNNKQAALTFTYPLVNSANTVSLAFGTTTANAWSSLQTFNGGFIAQGSTTIAGDLNVSGNATSTNATTTNLYVATSLRGAGLTSCSLSSSKLLWNSATGQFSCGADAGAGGGITALQAQYSAAQTGSTQTFATTSDTNIGLTITSAGDTHTFTPVWIGTLAVNRGGTGQSSFTSGQLIYGNGTNALTSVGTTTETLSAEFSYSGTLGALVGGTSGTLSLATNGVAYSKLAQAAANTILGNPTGATGNVVAFATSSLGIALADTTGTLTVARGGTGTTTAPSGQIIYGGGGGVYQSAATGTVAAGSGVSVTAGQSVIGSGLTITNTGVLAVGPAGQTTNGTALFATSTAGTDFTITGSGSTITFNLPTASGSARGLLSSSDWTTFNNKQAALTFTYPLVNTGNTVSIAFGTTTSNTWAGTQTFTNTPVLGSLSGVIYGNNGTLATAATSSIAVSGAFNYSGTLGTFVGGTNGTLSLATNGVALTNLAQIAANSVLVNNTSATGNVTAIATSTFFGLGNGGQVLTWNNGVPQWVATTTYAAGTGISTSFAAGQLTITNTGITSLQQTGGGSAQTGAITFATSSVTNNGVTIGLNVTNVGGAFTFTPTRSGTLTAAGGGTGFASYTPGDILYADTATTFARAASSTDGFVLALANGKPTWVATSTLSTISGTLGVTKGGTGLTSIASSSLLIGGPGNTFIGYATSSLGIALSDTTGTLSILRGGTGTTTAPVGQLIYGGATSYQSVATGTVASGSGISVTAGQAIIGSGLTITNTGLLSLQQLGGGSAQTGAITFATSSQTTNGQTIGLNITNTAGAFTFAPTIGGTLTVAGGGTGVDSFTAGQLIYGNGSNNLTSVATTSIAVSGAFTYSGTLGALVGGAGGTLSLATNGVALTNIAQIAANSILANGTGATGNVTALATSSLGIALADTTGTLAANRGGTGFATYTPGDILYADTAASLARVASSTDGFILGLANGKPTWVATTTLSSITGTLAISKGGTGTTTAPVGQLLYGGATSYQSVATGTVAAGTGVSVTAGQSVIGSGLTITNTGVIAVGPAGQTSNGTVTFASSTAGTDFTITGSGSVITFNLPTASASNRGLLTSTDWTTFNNKQAALTFTYPLVNSANTVSLAFGTTTANAWSSLQTFNGGITTSGTVTLGSLNGVLHAASGVVSASNVLLGSEVSGTLPVGNGGTGWSNIAANTLLLGNGSGALATTSAGVNGQALALVNGVPTWIATTTLTTISGSLNLASQVTGTLDVANGGTGSTTLSGILRGNGTGQVSTLVVGSGLTFDGTTLATSGAGITSIGAAGQQQTGGTQTFATSTGSFNGLTLGLTIVSSANTHTFTPSITGTLGVAGGGTGAASFTAGALVYGAGTGPLQTVATTTASLGLGLSGTLTTLNAGGTQQLSIATSSLYTGSQGQVAYFSGTNSLVGTSTLFITPSGTVGIGSTTPGATLGVTGSGYFTGNVTATTFAATGDSSTLLTSGGISIVSADTSAPNIAVGVYNSVSGVANSAIGLNNSANTATYSSAVGYGNNASGYLSSAFGSQNTASNNTSGAFGASNNVSGVQSYAFGYAITNAIDNTVMIGPSDAAKVTIRNTGKVGIGTTTPSAQLEVENDTNALALLLTVRNNYGTTGSAGSRIGFGVNRDIDPTALGASIDAINKAGVNNGDIAQGADLVFNTSPDATLGLAERLRITNVGDVGVGTNTPSVRLSVQGNGLFSGNLAAAGLTATGTVAFTNLSSGLVGSNNGTLYSLATSTSFVTSVVGGTGINVSGATGAVTISNTGLLSLQQLGGGSAQTGAITFATSSATNNGVTIGLNITNSGGAFTFTPTRSGTLTVAGGGTGFASYTPGDFLYADTATSFARVASSTDGFVLALANGKPTWVASTTLSTITGTLAVTKGGTGLTSIASSSLLIGGPGNTILGYATSSLGVALADTTGTLSIARGGTGTTTAPAGQILYGGGAGVYQSAATGTVSGGTNISVTAGQSVIGSGLTIGITGQIGVSNGGTGVGSFTAGQLIYGNGTNNLTSVATSSIAVSGAFSYSGTLGALVGGANGTLSLATNGVALTNIAQIAANSILANGTGATGNVTALATSSLGIALTDTTGTLAVNRGGTGFASYTPGDLLYANSATTFAKVSSSTDGFVLGLANGKPTWVATTTLTTISGSLNLASQVTGTLGVANGGTGSTTLSGILRGNGTGQVSTLIVGSGLTFDGTTLSSSGSGITAIGPTGQTQSGATITIASSTGSFNGLTIGTTIVGSGNTLTFTPSLSGTLTVAGGGTGVGSFTAGQLIYGNGTNNLTSVATTSASLGLGLSGTLTTLNAGGTQQLSIATSSLYTGTTGQFPYFSGTNTITATSSLFLATNGRVGIGTTTPSGYALTIDGKSGSSLYVTNDGSALQAVFAKASTGGFPDYIDGQIRIGAGLELQYVDNDSTAILRSTTGDLRIMSAANNTTIRVNGDRVSIGGDGYGSFVPNARLEVSANGTGDDLLMLSSTNTGAGDRFIVKNGGNVGVGTTSPYGKLSVVGNIVAANFIATTSASSTFAGPLSVSNLAITSNSGLLKASAGGYVVNAVAGTDYLAPGAVVSSIQHSFGSAQTGAITLATSSAVSFNGLTFTNSITNSGGTFTFTPALSGTLGVAGGGTGVGSFTAGQLIYGNGTNNLTSVATTSIATSGEFSYSGTLGALVGGSAGTLSLATNGVALTKIAQIGANTILGNNTGATGNVVAFATSSLGIALADTTGTLSIARGGTGTTTAPVGQLIYGGATSYQSVATGTVSSGTGISVTAGQYIIGSGLTITNTGLLSLQQLGGGSAQTGAITFATSSQTTNGQTIGLNITNSSGAFTFSPTISGTLTVAGGGTGQTSFTSSQLIYGNGTNGLVSVGTTTATLGLGLSGTLTTINAGGTTQQLSIATSSLYTGTTGQVAYFNATNGLVGTSTLFLATNQNVGVGTTTPWGQLSVNPNGITGPAFVVGSSTATKLIVTNGGTVGINTAAPSANYVLDVNGNANVNGTAFAQTGWFVQTNVGGDVTALLLQNSGGTGSVTQFFRNTNNSSSGIDTAKITSSIDSGTAGSEGGSLIFKTISGGTLAERARIASTSYFGIGTSSPFARLAVQANPNDATLGTTLFAIGSSTASATTTLFSISNTGSTTAANGFNILSGCFAINGVCLSTSGGGVTSIQQLGGGSAQTGAITFATSSATVNGQTHGLNITNTGAAFTFTPTLSGTLTVAGGGTGFASYTPGDFLYADTATSFAKVSSTTDGFVLALANGKPTWVASTTLSTITGTLGVTKGGTGLTSIASSSLLIGGPGNTILGYATSSLGVALSDTTGTLAIARGGTGTTTAPAGQILYGGGAGVYQSVATSSIAVSGAFSYSGTLGNFVGGANGTLSLATNGVALTNLAQIGANTILGNNTGATGNVVAFATSTLFGTGTGGQVLAISGGVPTWIASTTYANGTGISTSFAAGQLTISNTGLLSLQQTGGGSAQTGAITFATSSATSNGVTIGLNITNSSGAFTFTPTRSGTLTVGGGGTGVGSFTAGQLIYGNGTNNLSSVGTTTPTIGLGLTGANLVTLTSALGASSLSIATSSLYTGTTGQVAYFSGTNALAGTSTLAIGTNQFVGVGTTSPYGLLSINPNGIGSAPAFVIGSSTGTLFSVSTSGTTTTSNGFNITAGCYAINGTCLTTGGGPGALTPWTSNIDAATFNLANVGTIGVGTSSPYKGALTIDSGTASTTNTYLTGNLDSYLQLNIQNRNGGANASGDLVVTANNGTETTHYVDFGINGSGGGGQPFTGANHAYLYSVDDPLNIGALGASAYLTFNTTGGISAPVERMRIGANGNVGIASSTPFGLLSVNPDGLAAGVPAFVVGSSSATLFSVLTTGQVNIPTGSLAFPGLSFIGETTTGIYRPTASNLGVIIGATESFRFSGVNAALRNDGVYQFYSGNLTGTAADTGLSRLSAGTIAIGNGTAGNTSGTLVAATMGLGTSTPWGQLSVNPNGLAAGVPSFVIGSSSATNFIVTNNGLVGIGTTSPLTKLSLYSSFTASTTPFLVANIIGSTTPAFYIGSPNQHAAVGISTTSPTGRFAIEMGNFFTNQFVISNEGSTSPAFLVQGVNQNGRVGVGTSTPWAQFSVDSSNLGLSPAFAVGSSTGGTHFAVLNNGRVNVGTSTPWGQLNIGHSYNALGSTTPLLTVGINGSTTPAFYIGSPNQNGNVGVGSSSPWAKFSIGSTTAGNNSPSFAVQNNASTSFVVFASGVVGVGTSTQAGGGFGTSTIFVVGNRQLTGGVALFANSTGFCKINPTTTALQCTSDARYKQNVNNIAPAYDALMNLRPVTYNWLTEATGTPVHSGFIAQEVLPIFPDLVEEVNGIYTVNYAGLTPYLTSAFQQFAGAVNVRGALNATSTLRSLYQGTTTAAISVDAQGRVGIGTSTPNHTLDVYGDVAAISFVNTSTKTAKTDISYLSPEDTDAILSELGTLRVAEYHYKMESRNNPLRLGLIAEEAPSEVLSLDGKGVDIYKLSTFTLAGVQALASKVQSLSSKVADIDARLSQLQNVSIAIPTSTPATIGDDAALKIALTRIGVLIENGLAQFNTLVARQFVASKDPDGTSSAGSATILAGNTTIEVTSKLVHPSTKIFVTFNGPVDGWYLSEKKEGSFRVTLKSAAAADVSFDYFMVQTEGQLASPAGAVGDTGDTTPPELILNGASPFLVPVGGTYSDPGATATDAVDGPVSYNLQVNGQTTDLHPSLDTSHARTYTLTYTAFDRVGNFSTKTRTVVVGDAGGTTETPPTGTSTPPTAPPDTSNPPVTPPPAPTEGNTEPPVASGDGGETAPQGG